MDAFSSPIRAVFFDAGGTLFRPYPSVGHVYSRLARRYGCEVPADWVQSRFKTQWRRRNGLAHLKNTTEQGEKIWWSHMVRAVFGRRMPAKRFPDYFDELYDLFAESGTWRLFSDTMPALRALKRRGVRIGVVSNWDSRLYKLCDRLGVSRYVDFVLASAVVGSAKPDGNIFRLALRSANARPHEAVHVGDSYREDFWGARRAGLNALLIRRDSPPPAGSDCVSSLEEVLRWIDGRVIREKADGAPARTSARSPRPSPPSRRKSVRQ